MERIPNQSKKGGVDTYYNINKVCKALLQPECKRLLERNSEFCLIEDGARAHKSALTTKTRIQKGIKTVDSPSNSLEFNPIECIWTLMQQKILCKQGVERITTVKHMHCGLVRSGIKLQLKKLIKRLRNCPLSWHTVLQLIVEITSKPNSCHIYNNTALIVM